MYFPVDVLIVERDVILIVETVDRDAKMGHLQALDGEDQDVELVCLNNRTILCFLIDQIQASTI